MNLDLIEPGQRPPQVGDIVVSARLVRIVTDVRPIESRVWHDRWHLDLRKVGPRDPWPAEALADVLVDGARIIDATGRYQRGEGPADVARAAGLPVRAG